MFGFGKKIADPKKGFAQSLPEGWRMSELGLLGSGGMARVYRVRDEVLGREVALKVLRPELTKDEPAYESFVNEARITAQLDHPNIPTVYALALDRKKTSVFTMKVLEGRTLQQLLEKNERTGVNDLTESVEVLLRICDALAFAHSKGVLHLDLKPSNVIVADFGQIYLVDWGIARRKADLPKAATETLTAEGTPLFMSPEQATGHQWKFDERTDIFGLGGILYRILCGRPPHTDPTVDGALKKAAAGIVTPPDEVTSYGVRPMPRRLVAICMKALAADPAARYQSVREFQQDLDRYVRGFAQLPKRTFRAGEAIVTEGEPGDTAYVIIEGECVVTQIEGGQPRELRRLKAGEMFGETAVFSGQPRSATVRAFTRTVTGYVDQAALREEMERTSFMSLAIRTVTSTFLDLDRQSARERQRNRTVEMALRHMALRSEGGRTPWRPLQAALAQGTGASEDEVSSWVLGTDGFSLEGDSLVLRG